MPIGNTAALPPLAALAARLHLKHFRLLAAIDDHGTLVAAADAVALSQPAASKALQEIERTLAAPLFLRTSRGLVATDIGRCMIRYARVIGTDLANMREEMSGILEGHGVPLSVGAIMGAVPMVSAAVSDALAIQPDMRVTLREGTSGDLLHLLDQGLIDAAICRTSVCDRPDAYRATAICDEGLSIVAHDDHPLAGRAGLGFGDLSDCPWIVCEKHMPMRRQLEREFRRAGAPLPARTVETASFLAILELLTRTPTMCAMLPRDVADWLVRGGHRLTRLDVTPGATGEPYCAVTRADRPPGPAARIFLECLTGAARDDARRHPARRTAAALPGI